MVVAAHEQPGAVAITVCPGPPAAVASWLGGFSVYRQADCGESAPAWLTVNGDAWKLGAIAGSLLLGGIFGVVLAVFGGRGGGNTNGAAQTSRNTEAKSAFQQSFDASFKSSCRQSAMSSGNVSRAVADNYCDCALTVFNQTHSMAQAAASCKKFVIR